MDNAEVSTMEHQTDIYQDAVVFITGNTDAISKRDCSKMVNFNRSNWLCGQVAAGEAALEFSADQADLHAHPT